MFCNDLQRRYTFIHVLAFQVLRTGCCYGQETEESIFSCYGTYISSKTPKPSPDASSQLLKFPQVVSTSFPGSLSYRRDE